MIARILLPEDYGIVAIANLFITLSDILVDSGLNGLSFFGLLEDVCQSLDCPVDLIDTADVVADSRIEREIQRTGVVIYERQ